MALARAKAPLACLRLVLVCLAALLRLSCGWFHLPGGFRNAFRCWNGGGIAGDVADEAMALRGGYYRRVQLPGQFGGGEFGESV